MAQGTSDKAGQTPGAERGGVGPHRWWRLLGLLASVNVLPLSWAEAEPPGLTPGLYDIEVRINLPYVLEVSPPKRLTRCLTSSAIDSGQAFFVLSENPIRVCPISDYRTTATTAHYRILCPGANAASAEGEFETTETGYRGTISMQMGGKNMTMSETQVGVRVGACPSADP